MKKLFKILSLIIFIISILITSIIIISNLINAIRILFFGMTVGSSKYPNSIWWEKRELIGISGLKEYYSVWGEVILIFEVPIGIILLIYQIIYLKIIRKRFK